MKARVAATIFLAGAITLGLTGCERVKEPWDDTGYFRGDRVRTATQHKKLQERIMHTQALSTEQQMGLHQAE